MAVTTIDWDDGSGDKIYISADAFGGNQNVLVSSDANAGLARSKDITFRAGDVVRVLTVNQAAGVVEHTLSVNLSSYIPKSTDGSWYNVSNLSNAYSGVSGSGSSSYCGITLERGAGAETYIYFLFDTSGIPDNATIKSVECKAKVSISNTTAANVASRGAKLCSGTTEKTASVSVTTTAAIRTFTMGTWTKQELSDVRLKMYATRGESNTTSNYALRVYGATLTIVYTVPANEND